MRARLVLAVGLGATLLAARPVERAEAAVRSISPASAVVAPGGSASATVRVEGEIVSCLRVASPHSTIVVSVSPECDAGSWTSSLVVNTATATPTGSYAVEVTDAESTRGFTLHVSLPSTTRPPPSSTTQPIRRTIPSTVAPPPTTPPPTTPPPTTPPVATTAAVAPVDPTAFVAVADLLAAGLPDEGVFFPLLGSGVANCLPLTTPCRLGSSSVILLPAELYGLTWAPLTDLGGSPAIAPSAALVPSLRPVGRPPLDLGVSTFGVGVLDLSDDVSFQLVARRLDADGKLVRAAAGRTMVVNALEGPPIASPTGTNPSPTFGPPFRLSTAGLVEASPALVVVADTGVHVVHALRGSPAWDVGAVVIPLLGGDALPYLVRGADGPVGLLVPSRPDLSLPRFEATPSEVGGSNWTGLRVLVLVALAGVVGIGLPRLARGLRRWRRR